jgi:copper chaperone CopZ
MYRSIILSIALIVQVSFIFAQQPIELGKVNWQRDYDTALELSEQRDKPVFIQFQEVPGCSTCSTYGKNVLSNPLIVEAIETYFIPLAIYNNKGGKDKEILKKYKEPTWNNPVARIVNKNGKNIVDRLSGNYSELAVVNTLMNAMIESAIPIPGYLELLQEELSAEYSGTKEAVFSMYCFWTGEKEIAQIPGVVGTDAGFMNGAEVVKIKYDPKVVSLEKLATSANKQSCASAVFTDVKSEQKLVRDKLGLPTKSTGKYRDDKENKYFLFNSKYKSIPMTNLQATRVNSSLAKRINPEPLLSPRQLAVLNSGNRNKNMIGQSIDKIWEL